MKKAELNAKMRAYVHSNLSPTQGERDLVSKVYQSIQEVLGNNNCLQIGSYPRYTAITPLHDLDVLYILGDYQANADPKIELDNLHKEISRNYKNPTSYKISVSLQSHSVTIKFLGAKDEEVFSTDIVPAYKNGRNNFGDDMYVVPEIAVSSHADRQRILLEQKAGRYQMKWIKTDPRGYITVASNTNARNEDFRRAVKFVKGWRSSCKKVNKDFPLKSFHIEQIVTNYYQANPVLEIFDAVFKFFVELPEYIHVPRIPDRADQTKYIDEYLNGVSKSEKDWVLKVRDCFLIALEELKDTDDISVLFAVTPYTRASATESFLFDQNIPMLTEGTLKVIGEVQPRTGGFRKYVLTKLGMINIDRKISFSVVPHTPQPDLYKWKVKNDNSSLQPRGEITDHHTMMNPENTRYDGQHFVECFAIKNGVCIARGKQNVTLDRYHTDPD